MARPEPGTQARAAQELLDGLPQLNDPSTDAQVKATAAVAYALLALGDEVNTLRRQLQAAGPAGSAIG